MTHSSFSPPTGCSLIRLSDDESPPTPERLGPLLTRKVTIIYAGDKLFVPEKTDAGVRITEKDPGHGEVEIAQIGCSSNKKLIALYGDQLKKW